MVRTEKLTDVQEAELKLMFGPIDGIFAELRSRYEQIPTTGQTDTLEDSRRNDRRRVAPNLSARQPDTSAQRR